MRVLSVNNFKKNERYSPLLHYRSAPGKIFDMSLSGNDLAIEIAGRKRLSKSSGLSL